MSGGQAESEQQSKAGRSLLASSATVSAFNALGVLAGFALDAAVAALFGVGWQTDAYFSAYRLPYAIIAVLNMVAGAALVPMFARALTELGAGGRRGDGGRGDGGRGDGGRGDGGRGDGGRGDGGRGGGGRGDGGRGDGGRGDGGRGDGGRGDGGRGDPAPSPLSPFFSNVLHTSTLIVAAVTVLGVVGSAWIMTTLYRGLADQSLALAVDLGRILFLSVLLTGPVEALRSFLYAHRVFGIPTAINFVRSAVTLAVLAVGLALIPGASGNDWVGLHLLAWGVVAGVACQLLVVAWQAARHTGLRWRPVFDLRDPRLRQTGRAAGPITAGALVRQGINVAETAVAAFLPPGSVTIVSYANRLTFVVSSVLLTSITTASTPAMSQAMSQGRKDQVRALLISALRLTTFVAVPIGLALAALGVPIIRLLFERGRFTPEASQLTGLVLSLYAVSVLFLGYSRVVQAYYYAALRTGVVLVLFVVLAVVSIGLDVLLAPRIGVQGIAIGFSVGAVVSTGLGLAWLWRDRGQWSALEDAAEQGQLRRQLRGLALLAGKVTVASLAMAAAAAATLRLMPDGAWALLPALAVGGAVFLAAAFLLRVRELWLLRDVLAGRARPKGAQ